MYAGTAFVVAFCLSLSFCCRCAAFDEPSEYLLIYDGTDKLAPRIVDIDGVIPGESKTVAVRFRNGSNASVRFENVVVGCKCLNTRVSKDELSPGEHTRMEFQFDVDKSPRSLVKVLQAQLELEDKSSITLQFKLHYKQLAGFAHDDFSHTTFREDHEKNAQTTFMVPLVISADIAIRDVRPVFADNLKFVSFEICEVQSRPFLKGTYLTERIDDLTEVGEIKLNVKRLSQSQAARLSLEVEGRYKLFPEILTLSESDKDGSYAGALMLRVRGNTAKDSVTSVEFGPEVDAAAKIECVPLNTGIYRLKCSIPSQAVQVENITVRIKHAGIRTDFCLKCRYPK